MQNNPNLQTFPGQAPPFLSEQDTSHLWNTLLSNESLDTQYLDLFGVLIGGNPMGTTGNAKLGRRADNTPRGSAYLQYHLVPAYTSIGSSIQSDAGMSMSGPMVPPTPTLAQTGSRQNRQEFACIQCGITYDRRARARDCQYQDRGETPYQCRGACGDIWWSVYFFRI